MATLAKDNGSDWHASGVKHRDFRHIKDEPEVQHGKQVRKSTRVWCKGKVGTKHDVVFAPSGYRGAYRCVRCDKRWYSRPDFAQQLPEVRMSWSHGPVWEIVPSK